MKTMPPNVLVQFDNCRHELLVIYSQSFCPLNHNQRVQRKDLVFARKFDLARIYGEVQNQVVLVSLFEKGKENFPLKSELLKYYKECNRYGEFAEKFTDYIIKVIKTDLANL